MFSLGFTSFYWVLLSFTGMYPDLPSFIRLNLLFTGFYWVLLGFSIHSTELYLFFFLGFYLVYMIYFSRVLLNFIYNSIEFDSSLVAVWLCEINQPKHPIARSISKMVVVFFCR